MTVDVIAPAVDRLAQLADIANAAHLVAHRNSVEVGRALLEAEAILPPGTTFEQWVTENCAFKPRMARNYKRVARAWLKLSESERQRVAALPIRKAVEEHTQSKNSEFVLRSDSVLTQDELPGGALFSVPVVEDWIIVLRTMSGDQQARSRESLFKLRDQIDQILSVVQQGEVL